jgi:hypothetical protein
LHAGGLTYALCRSEQRIAKDRAIRTKQEGRMQADIDKLLNRIAKNRLTDRDKINQAIGRLKERYPRVARYFDLAYDPMTQVLVAEEKQDKAAQLDGCYVLKTSRNDLSADELWRLYALLRDMKTPLAERPIFHHLERRVDSHVFLCVIAYHLLAAIEQTLLHQDIHTSWATVRNTLKTHQLCTIVLPSKENKCLRIRKAATPDPDVKDLHRLLDISSQIIKPIRTWSEQQNSD